MPPRYTYWTIVIDGGPTAFRARTPDELVPTLRQLRSTQPTACLRWFASGRLWASPLEWRQFLARIRRRPPAQHARRRAPSPAPARSGFAARSRRPPARRGPPRRKK